MKNVLKKIKNLFFLLVVSTAFVAFSSSTAQEKKGKKVKSTVINFEDELIEGSIKKPELLYLLQKKQFNFKRLIKLRDNFIPEMYKTAEEMEVDRSSD